jgi:hypothetical protein
MGRHAAARDHLAHDTELAAHAGQPDLGNLGYDRDLAPVAGNEREFYPGRLPRVAVPGRLGGGRECEPKTFNRLSGQFLRVE